MSKRTKGGRVKNPPAVEVPKDMIGKNTLCQFCHQGETKDILQSGRLYKLSIGNKSVEYYHYFCLLFSSQGVQRGKDEEGLNGFLPEDIRNEVKRGSGIKCDMCKAPGATIPCRVKKCKKNYHFTCGATTNPEHLFIFRNNMDSFCWTHAPQQKKTSHVVSDATCMVCLDSSSLTPGPGPGKLVSPCCGRTFHRDCVQKTALQAGKVSLKCPACNTKDKFNEEMERCGIYIPHADATWEMPENSGFYRFEDMLHLYRNCDAVECKSTKGRDYSKPGTDLELVKCQTCGQSGVHILCGKLNMKEKVYICSSCKPPDNDDDDDEELQSKLLKHEQRRLELLAKKDRLIMEERERLAATKKKQDDMIAKIKAIFASDPIDEDSKEDQDIQFVGSKVGARVQIVNKLTGDCVPVQGCPPPPPEPFRLLTSSSSGRPNTAMGMPRRQLEKAESSSSEEDEELNKVLKISAIFSGDDVNKLDAFLPKSCIAETPPPAKTETVEVEVETQKKNLETEQTQSCDSMEETSVSSKLDPLENAEAEKNVSEQGEEEEEKPTAEYNTDSEDDLEEILADEFKEDQDSLSS